MFLFTEHMLYSPNTCNVHRARVYVHRALVYVHRARVYVHRARVYINRTLCVDLARAYFKVWFKIDPHTKKVPYFKHLGLPRFFTKTEHVLPPFFLWKTEHVIY